jgi:hypothetical protein
VQCTLQLPRKIKLRWPKKSSDFPRKIVGRFGGRSPVT